MTYPLDDKGNVRVDFVWGHMPAQPNDGRTGYNQNPYTTDGNWTVKGTVGNTSLTTGYAYVTRNTGDGWQNEINRERPELIDYGSADIITTGWSNYPAFIPNYAGDGDSGLEIVMPDLSKINYLDWQSVIEGAGLVYAHNNGNYGSLANNNKFISQDPVAGRIVDPGTEVTTTRTVAPLVPNLIGLADPTAAQDLLATVTLVLGDTNPVTQGATQQNDGKVATQSVPAGTAVDAGSAVTIGVYHYVSAINHTLAGIRKDFGGSSNAYGQYWLFLQGRNHNLVNGDTITISGCDVSAYNGTAWNVISSVNDDAFNTGGTKVLLFWNGAEGSTANASTGTYTKTS